MEQLKMALEAPAGQGPKNEREFWEGLQSLIMQSMNNSTGGRDEVDMGAEAAVKPLLADLRNKFVDRDFEDPELRKDMIEYLREQQAEWDAPQALKDELLDYIRRANSWDEVRGGLYEGYKFYLDYEMNMKPKGRPLPDMEGVLGIMQDNQELLQEIFAGALQETWAKWEEAPANVDVQAMADCVGPSFLLNGPGAVGPCLLEFGLVQEQEMSGEEYQKLIDFWNTPILPAMMQGVAEVMKQSGEYDRQEAKAVVVYLRMMLKLISEEEA